MRKNRIGKYENINPERNHTTGRGNPSNHAYGQYKHEAWWDDMHGFNWEDMFSGGYKRSDSRTDERDRQEEQKRRTKQRQYDAREARKREEARQENLREEAEIKRNSEAHRRREEEEKRDAEILKRKAEGNYGTIRDCIYTVKSNCIEFNAEILVGERWGLDNFVFFTGGHPSVTVDLMKEFCEFRFESNGKRYVNKLNISKIWGIDENGKERAIY